MTLAEMQVQFMRGKREALGAVEDRLAAALIDGQPLDIVKDELRQVDHWLAENAPTPVGS